jgi:hypothetical protein
MGDLDAHELCFSPPYCCSATPTHAVPRQPITELRLTIVLGVRPSRSATALIMTTGPAMTEDSVDLVTLIYRRLSSSAKTVVSICLHHPLLQDVLVADSSSFRFPV